MKKTIIFFIIILVIKVSAQYQGTTQTGSLLPQPKAVEYNSPLITIYSPRVNNGDTLTVYNNQITISGIVKDDYPGIKLFVNNTNIQLNGDNQYSYFTNLSKGLNAITLRAENVHRKTSLYLFYIKYILVETKPIVEIIEPNVRPGKDFLVNEKSIAVHGIASSPNGINKILVNNNKATLLTNNEFFYNYNLSSGRNQINIRVYDNHNNFSDTSIIVTYRPVLAGPVIRIIDPPAERGIEMVSKKEVVKIRGVAVDENGVKSVSVNDMQANLLPTGEFDIDYYLHLGKNQIIVKAANVYNVTTIDTFYIDRNLESILTAGRYIALIIGIDSYTGHWPHLNNAVHDAESLSEVLKNDYVFDTVITLLDKKATRTNIINDLDWLTTNTKPEDNVLIYYSGHGQFNKILNKGFWVPVDATTNSTAGYISNSDVKTYIGGIPAKHTLLISDACFAGDIFRGPSTESIPFDPNNMDKYYRDVYRKPSKDAITSGGLEEVTDAGKDGHSVFAYYLLKSLKNAPYKFWDSSQLFNDFKIAVTNNSEQTPEMQAIRDAGDEGGQFVFVRK